ncbi:autotransporter outer membrane beta-barrel domain-containing protein [Dyella dinghuensis]|uniref:Autotransporter outer membrane beta-barrel domain-containing protein n=1 Tax=Dyella dinghuensis TaxID=1920169 RepID=A0A432LZ52_9GAMM|nr:autotransporter outer membrane beta-barrel domain-containing protein [Dyella dinghuensis]RUL67226.1 autotransporter outer membrane beta-barrel domain-containing protein [Dyella dinghuensis]
MRRTAHLTACSGVIFVGLALTSGSVFAQSTDSSSSDTFSPALDRFSLSLGGYYADTSTTIGAGLNQYDVHGNLNLQHDLGFPQHEVVPRLRADFLLGDSQGFSFDYYRVEQSRTGSANAAFNFNGNAYDANASITGRLNFDFGSAAYKWWFGHSSDVFGVGLGAGYYHIFAGIKGQASLNGNFEGEAGASASENAWAPELELGWRHAFTDNIRMYFNAQGLKKNGDLGGHIYDGALGVEWFPWKNVGFGAEYDYTRISVHDRKEYYHDDVALDLDGPSVYLRFRF